jgi:serine/threonine protein kinase
VWKNWHLSSKYFIAKSARGQAFIKVNKNPSLVENEIRISRLLRSAGVPVPETWFTDRVLGHSIIIMEAFPGIKLREILSRTPGNNPDLTTVADQLIEIVDGLHEARVIHRDLTPANILVSTNPEGIRLNLIDFTFSVDAANSSESVLKPIGWVSARLGEGYKPRVDLWDDAYAAMLIIDEMLSNGASVSEQARLIEKRVGRLEFCYAPRNRG